MSTLEIIAASVAYAAVGAVIGRLVAGDLAWRSWEKSPTYIYHSHRYATSPDSGQWFGASCVGLLVLIVWPLVIAIRAIPSERWAVGAEARGIARERDERIAELEKELEIR